PPGRCLCAVRSPSSFPPSPAARRSMTATDTRAGGRPRPRPWPCRPTERLFPPKANPCPPRSGSPVDALPRTPLPLAGLLLPLRSEGGVMRVPFGALCIVVVGLAWACADDPIDDVRPVQPGGTGGDGGDGGAGGAAGEAGEGGEGGTAGTGGEGGEGGSDFQRSEERRVGTEGGAGWARERRRRKDRDW